MIEARTVKAIYVLACLGLFACTFSAICFPLHWLSLFGVWGTGFVATIALIILEANERTT